MRAACLAAGAGLAVVLLPLAGVAQPTIEHRVAVLQGLDKVTARIELLEVPLGEETLYGSLAIRAQACLETPPTEPPESVAFLEIDVVAADGGRQPAFVGWMYASTPGLSALEHPVYDVWVIDCRAPLSVPPVVERFPLD